MSDLESLPGVGPATAKKLEEAGFGDLISIAVASPSELAAIVDIGEGTAVKIIQAARQKADVGGFETGDVIFDRYSSAESLTEYISTGVKRLDNIIGGGIRTFSLYEIFGKPGTGKTQFLYQLSCMVQLSREEGGLEKDVIFIDTKNSFYPKRFREIAKAHGLDPDGALSKIHYANADNSSHQILLIEEKTSQLFEEENIGLIVIDDITSHFVNEYRGREKLADRQQKLYRHLSDLKKVARNYNCAVVYSNIITYGNDSIGGAIIHNMSHFRILLSKNRDSTFTAKLVYSPYMPDDKVKYKITERGLEDI